MELHQLLNHQAHQGRLLPHQLLLLHQKMDVDLHNGQQMNSVMMTTTMLNAPGMVVHVATIMPQDGTTTVTIVLVLTLQGPQLLLLQKTDVDPLNGLTMIIVMMKTIMLHVPGMVELAVPRMDLDGMLSVMNVLVLILLVLLVKTSGPLRNVKEGRTRENVTDPGLPRIVKRLVNFVRFDMLL